MVASYHPTIRIAGWLPLWVPGRNGGRVSIDRLDYHWDAVEDAGQPGEQGFVHIACFLAWVLAHRMHARGL